MKGKPMIEPKGVDLVIEGGDMTAADLKAFRALLRKSQATIQSAQKKMGEQPWMDEPVPTLQQLVALQRQREKEAGRTSPTLPPGTQDIDESGIGGSTTPEENAYMSAYLWSSQRTMKRYQETTRTLTLALEPATRWSTVKQKSKSKKA
jgi:hypothetical protein